MNEEWRGRFERAVKDAQARAENAGEQLSYAQISRDAGLSENYVQQAMGGAFDPTINKLLKLCEVLKVSPIWVLFGLDAKPKTMKLADAINRLPKNERKLLEAFVSDRQHPHSPDSGGNPGNGLRRAG